MLALSPSLVSTIGWYFENHTSHDNHDQNFVHGDHSETLDSILHFSTSQTQFELGQTTPQTAICRDQNMFKKLDHDASERDRRKKMNGLYSSLTESLFKFWFGKCTILFVKNNCNVLQHKQTIT